MPIIQEWATFGDIAVNGSIVTNLQDALLEFDSGTTGVVGPVSAVAALFNLANIQSVLIPSKAGNTLVGYYPCSSPPTIGLSLPSKSNLTSSVASNTSTIFDIGYSAQFSSQNGNNCTSAISGFDYEAQPGLWVIGQAFFQGKYVDHDLDNGIMGFAVLGEEGSEGTTTSNTPKSTATAASGASRIGISVVGGLAVIETIWIFL